MFHDQKLSSTLLAIQMSSFPCFFNIFCLQTPWLDGRHTVFGKVLEGEDVVKRVEEQGTNSGKPKNKVTVVESGELK